MIWLAMAAASAQGLDWTACDWVDPGDGAAECATLWVPLSRDVADGLQQPVAVQRVPAEGTSRGQLWLVDGGPGDSGLATLPDLGFLRDAAPDLDLYAFDHRGVGASARLGCPDQERPGGTGGVEVIEEEWEACKAWLEVHEAKRLPSLTATEASGDLAALIDATAAPGDLVVLWGISYGTWLVNRFLQLYPDRAGAVLLDGLVPADWTFDEFDGGLDVTGRRLLERCADHPDCADHLGDDPVGRAEALLEALDDGHCGRLGVDADLGRLLMGIFLMVQEWRADIPALIVKLERCTGPDIRSIARMFDHRFPEDGDTLEAPSHSQVLQNHVVLTDLWAGTPLADLEAAAEGAVMTTGVSVAFAERAPGWPVAPAADPPVDFAAFDGPMLLLHGTLDPTMPIERVDVLEDAFAADGQTLVRYAGGAHVVVNHGGCALDLYADFLADPGADLDTGCAGEPVPIDFSGDPDTNETVWGDPDKWGDGGGCAGADVTGGAATWLALLVLPALRRRRAPNPEGCWRTGRTSGRRRTVIPPCEEWTVAGRAPGADSGSGRVVAAISRPRGTNGGCGDPW